METISLASYESEIDLLLEQKKYDEAIAHSIHVLKSYPKNVNTLRLLAKAFLEKQQYSEAAQDFLRVLSVIPTDFIAHIGMSVIREDESRIDAAIWHMERAFEQQPVNPAIQDELRRLYSIKKLEEPGKIHLSRAALMRMYIRGKLIPQAVAEAEASLNEEPERLDLQTTLAQLYLSSGMTEKAADLSKDILEILPDNLTANQIMSSFLSSTGREDEASMFTQRAKDLDPGSLIQKNEGKPVGEIAQAMFIAKLDDLTFQSISEMVAASRVLLGSSIPVYGIEDWLKRVENYQKTLTPLLPDASAGDGSVERERTPQTEIISEENVTLPVEKVEENTEVIPIIQPEDISAQSELVESELISEEEIETVILESKVTDPIAQPAEQPPAIDQNEEITLFPEEILGEPAEVETNLVADEMLSPEIIDIREATSKETIREFDETFDFKRVEDKISASNSEEDIEQPEPLDEEAGDKITQSAKTPLPTEQEPLTEGSEEDLQDYAEVSEGSIIDTVLLQDIPTSGEAAFEEIAVSDEAQIEQVILSEGWIPIGTPSLEEEQSIEGITPDIPDTPEEYATNGLAPSADQVQFEPEEISEEETNEKTGLIEEPISSQVIEEEITKPVQIIIQDSVSEIQGEGSPDTTGKNDEISYEGASQIDSPEGQAAQIEEEISEKKYGFMAWLKSVRGVVQEEIKEPRIPAWMQTGKPTERIKVPEVSELIEQEPAAMDGTPPQPEMSQSLPLEQITEELEEKNNREEIEEKPEVTAESDEFPAPSIEEDEGEEEIWEVGYQTEEIEGTVERKKIESVILENPKYIEDLERARLDVNEGNFLKASEKYKKIIKTSKNLNNVILSLEEGVKNNPEEFKLIQTLGDAYVRIGRLQDALDAYTKAEELLK